MSPFAVTALYDTHLSVGASGVDAVVRITASGIDEPGVAASLRVWTPLGATVAVLREHSPAAVDLHGAIRLDDRTVEYPAGPWTDGTREYELVVALPTGHAGDEMLAARFGVVVGDEVLGAAPIAVTWIDDRRLTVRSGGAAPPARPSVVTAEELPTGPSPQPRHPSVDAAHAGEPCAGCGLRPGDGDRYCEACGYELGAGRPG